MSRALEYRAACVLLKKSFSAKGATLSHTEALDLYAKLQGYEAWAHLQTVQSGLPKPVVPSAAGSRPSKPASEGKSFGELWVERYSLKHSFPSLPREDWKHETDNDETHQSYFDWVDERLQVHLGVMVSNTLFLPSIVSVTGLDGTVSDWSIETDLTDRWGDYNTANLNKKSALPFLALDEPLLNRCRVAMVEEDSFIVCKDGKFGVLVEVEYECQESVPEDNISGALPRTEVVQKVLAGLAAVKARYPQVEVGIPDPSVVYDGRVAAWCYFELEEAEKLTQEQKVELSGVMGCLDMVHHTSEFALAGLPQA